MCIPVRKLFTTHIITWDTPCITGYYWDVVWLPSSLQQTNIAIEFSTIDNDIPTKTEYIFSLVFCMICMFTSGYYPLTHCDAAEPAVRSLWWRVAHGATCNPSWHWRGGWPRSWDGWPLGSKMGSFSMFQQQLCVVYLWCNLRCHCFLFWDRPLEWQWKDSKMGEVLMNMRTLRKKMLDQWDVSDVSPLGQRQVSDVERKNSRDRKIRRQLYSLIR